MLSLVFLIAGALAAPGAGPLARDVNSTSIQSATISSTASNSAATITSSAVASSATPSASPSSMLSAGSVPASLHTVNGTKSAVPAATQGAYDSNRLSALWQLVEQSIPVYNATITTVLTNTSFEKPKDPPPLRLGYTSAQTKNLKLPKGFKYAFATAATQVEGATKADGKGPSAWDYLCHNYPSTGCSNFTADITDNNYYMYPLDFARMKWLGANSYSFSTAWTRIYPFGKGPVNEAGLQHYDNVIKELEKHQIEPLLTLFHWDTPLNLMAEYGSWLTTDNRFVDDFVAYATTMFKRYGKQVKTWVTFNEPRVFCGGAWSEPALDFYIPAGINQNNSVYQCYYNLLKAHGAAVQVYRQLVKNGTIAKGEIGFKSDDNKPVPYRDGNKQDIEACNRHADYFIGAFAQPVYGDGNWPKTMRDTLGNLLPNFTAAETKMIKGSADFFAIDGYRTNVGRAVGNFEQCKTNSSDPFWPVCIYNADSASTSILESGWALGATADPRVDWLMSTGGQLRDQLKWLHTTYPSPKIYLSEFGFAEPYEWLFGEISDNQLFRIKEDYVRANYFVDYLNEALLSIHEDKVPLAGAFAWSLLDNHEWQSNE